MFVASLPLSSPLRSTVGTSSESRSAGRTARKSGEFARATTLLIAGFGIAVAASFAGFGVAAAAPVVCSSPPTGNSVVVDDQASCGATATGVGQAKALASDSGTAVSVADESGTSTAVATGYGVALGASHTEGQSYALSLGGGIAQSMAENGITTIALAGFGSGATAGTTGVNCVGPLSMALNMGTGQFCAFGR